jgi:hypothetical protein
VKVVVKEKKEEDKVKTNKALVLSGGLIDTFVIVSLDRLVSTIPNELTTSEGQSSVGCGQR